MIAGQEHGTKAEHLKYAAKGKYPDEKILMIGDANGDLKAARSNGVVFSRLIPVKKKNHGKNFLQKVLKGSFQELLKGLMKRN